LPRCRACHLERGDLAMYQLTSTSTIVRLSDGAFIPADPANVDYAECLAWLDLGNEPKPYVQPPAPITKVVTRRQGRLALIDLGKLLEVEAMIAAIEDPVERLKAQVEYEADTW